MKTLGDVCAFDKAQGIHRGLPYVGLEHIESQTARFIGSTDPQPVKSSTFRFSDEHVLYGRLRPYLNKALAPDFAGHCSTEIFPLKPSRELSREYLLYWLLADETCERINATCTGARMPRAQMNEVMGFDFPLPPPAEQQRIVSLLDDAFEGITTAKANAEKNLQNARALFESHLQSVFTRRGKGWVETAIGEICDIKHGFAFDGADFSNDVPDGNPLVITPGNFTEDGKLLFNERNTKRFSGDIPAGFQFDIGDLVVVMTDLSSKMKILGKPAFVETDDVLHNQRIGRLVFSTDRVEKRMLYYFMMTEGFLKNIKMSATGTMVKHTAPKRIMSNVIPFPENRKEQRAIVSKLDDLREETQRLASIYERKLAALEALKKSLLHQAFTGEL
jgi:type I restriction enzyme S subunit